MLFETSLLSVILCSLASTVKATSAGTATADSSDSAATADSISQSSSTCNPLKASTCDADPALGKSISLDFTTAENDYFEVYKESGSFDYGDDGVSLTLEKQYDNPSLQSSFYLMFGKVEVVLKSANGTGIVSSFYLQSDDLDEIDLEWFGGDGYEVQSNFFSKGDTTTYDRGQYHNMADPRADFHNYTIDWTESELVWYVDGTPVRTLANDTSSGYPQTPMKIIFGIWAGGDPSNEVGTIEWAGGETDYSEVPFAMHVKSLVVSDYSTGTEYSYGDQSGDYTSIQSSGGSVNGRKEKGEAEFAALVAGGSIDSSSDSSSESSLGSSTRSSAGSSTTKKSSSATASGSVTKTSSDSVSTGSDSPSSTTVISSDDLQTKANSATTLSTQFVNGSTSGSATADSGSSSAHSITESNGAYGNVNNDFVGVFAAFASMMLFAFSML